MASGWRRWRTATGSTGARLFVAFAVISLVPVVALGAVLAVQYRHELESRAVIQSRAQGVLLARQITHGQISGRDLRKGITAGERRRLGELADGVVDSGTVTGFQLYTVAGRVVYRSSTDSPTAPKTDAGRRTRAERKAETDRQARVIRQARAGRTEAWIAGPQIEVFAPLRDSRSGRVIGVLELWIPYAPIAADLTLGLHHLYLGLGVGLATLYLVLGLLTGWAGRRLARGAAQFEHQALHDPLTGLPNRTLLVDRIGQTVAGIARHGGGAAVALVDLDRFREINDALGHENGDLLLRTLARRLSERVRGVDTVAHLGGDEFGLILPGVQRPDQLEAAMARIRAAIQDEVVLGGLPLRVEASLGVAFIPRDGTRPGTLLRHADVAMRTAKETQTGLVCYDQDQNHYSADRLALVSELRGAVERDELVLHYQPQIHRSDGGAHSFEALVRWQHPTRGLLGPDLFVPLAEQTGLIGELTDWVLNAALAQLAEWHTDRPGLSVAVNVSARSLHHLDFPGSVRAALERAGVGADRLLLEITETALITDAARAAVVLKHLAGAGLRLSLDDFGQGYTSLNQLSALPLNELKIDKSFVMNMEHSPGDAAIVRSVIDLAHNLGLQVVAEGVENDEVLRRLVDLDCDITQGYFFSRPLPAGQVSDWLAAHEIEQHFLNRT